MDVRELCNDYATAIECARLLVERQRTVQAGGELEVRDTEKYEAYAVRINNLALLLTKDGTQGEPNNPELPPALLLPEGRVYFCAARGLELSYFDTVAFLRLSKLGSRRRCPSSSRSLVSLLVFTSVCWSRGKALCAGAILSRLVSCAYAEGLEEAMELFLETLQLETRVWGRNHPEVVSTHRHIADTAQALNR